MDAEEIGRLIGELENRVERLRALYEQYFMGIERLEPLTVRKDIDRRLWALRREQIRNTGLRFKLETTIQRYNTYQQYWQRIVREIEQGTYQRDLGRAAQRFGDNVVTAFARRRQKMFEKAVTKKAERDARRTGPGASEAPVAEADEAPPSSNETFDVTFEDSDAPASTRSPGVPAPSPIEPLELDIGGPTRPRPDPAAAVVAPFAERRGPPAAPRVPVPAGVRPAPPIASTGTPSAPAATPASPAALAAPAAGRPMPARPAPPATSGQAAAAAPGPRPFAPPVTAPKPAVPATPAATAPKPASPAAPVATAPKPSAPAAPAAKPAAFAVSSPQTVAASAKPASPASPRPAAAGSPAPSTGSLPRPRPEVLPGQKPPVAPQRPAAPSRPDAQAPPVSREDSNSLSPIRMRQIYGAFVEAKRRANESTASVTYEKIASNLESVAKELRAKHNARSVDFEVVMKNGKPVLKPVVKG